MLVSMPFSHVVALDAASGAERWRYQHQRRPGPANRSVAEAADAGEALSQLAANDPLRREGQTGATSVGMAMAPQVVDGQVIVGVTSVGYGLHRESAVVGLAPGWGLTVGHTSHRR